MEEPEFWDENISWNDYSHPVDKSMAINEAVIRSILLYHNYDPDEHFNDVIIPEPPKKKNGRKSRTKKGGQNQHLEEQPEENVDNPDLVESKKVRKTRKSNSKKPGFVDEGMDDMEEMDSDSLNNSFEQQQKRVRIDISPHDDGMSDGDNDDQPSNTSKSDDHQQINDDDETNLPPAKRKSKNKTSSEEGAHSSVINMSLQSLIREASLFRCEICNFSATTRRRLNNHKIKNHTIESD